MLCMYTHSFGVNGVYREKQSGEEREVAVFKHTLFAGVHEQRCHHAVQKHVHQVEVEWSHAAQQNVQPAARVKNRETVTLIRHGRELTRCNTMK